MLTDLTIHVGKILNNLKNRLIYKKALRTYSIEHQQTVVQDADVSLFLQHAPVEGSCKHGNETSGSIKAR
jgi:hypothetical protein